MRNIIDTLKGCFAIVAMGQLLFTAIFIPAFICWHVVAGVGSWVSENRFIATFWFCLVGIGALLGLLVRLVKTPFGLVGQKRKKLEAAEQARQHALYANYKPLQSWNRKSRKTGKFSR
jgi:hypothetical protein